MGNERLLLGILEVFGVFGFFFVVGGGFWDSVGRGAPYLVAHDCGYPLSRYTRRATRVAADFLDFTAFCRCSTGVALHPLKILTPPRCPRRCRTEIWV